MNESDYICPPDTPDVHEEGYQAYYDQNPTPENYLDIHVTCPDYAPGCVMHEVFYQGVDDGRRHYERNL